ncbi:unnamed protein product, partial [marine sediment metagenome]
MGNEHVGMDRPLSEDIAAGKVDERFGLFHRRLLR